MQLIKFCVNMNLEWLWGCKKPFGEANQFWWYILGDKSISLKHIQICQKNHLVLFKRKCVIIELSDHLPDSIILYSNWQISLTRSRCTLYWTYFFLNPTLCAIFLPLKCTYFSTRSGVTNRMCIGLLTEFMIANSSPFKRCNNRFA